MKKKILAIALIFAMIFAFTACGGGGGESSEGGQAEPTASADRMGDSVDLMTTDAGTVKYIGIEKAVPELTEDDNDDAYVFVFEFTNFKDDPATVQDAFYIQFFQNGAEISNSGSWNSVAKEQYDLINAQWNTALKDGTVTYGALVFQKDGSPVTIMASDRDNNDNRAMVEVNLSDGKASGGNEGGNNESSIDVETALQGDWILQEVNTFHFENGTITLSGEGVDGLSGEYTVNEGESMIDCVLHDSSQNLKIHLPYKVEGDTLRLFNNHDEEMVHQ